MRYTVVLEDEADGGFSVSVPALLGCRSQGDTRDEALTNIREAIELYVETLREAGEPIPAEVGREFVEVEAAGRWPSSRPTCPVAECAPRWSVPDSSSSGRKAAT
jgi:predicted RNase H-like HicB family nuclease